MDIGLLFPALGGYWFLTRTSLTRYGVIRQSGYHLFFNSAFFGFGFYFLGWLLAPYIRSWLPGVGAWLDRSDAPFPQFDAVLISLLLAFGLSLILNFATKPGWMQKALLERDRKNHGQLIDLLLREAMETGSLIELSMRNGKSYIGYVTDRGGTTEAAADVGLLPVLSGYRANDTSRLVITTNYSRILQLCQEAEKPFAHLSPEQLKVLLPSREILSARHFDLAVANYFGHLSSISDG